VPRYKLIIEYAGTRYSGWQIQKNARTIQGELHKALGEALSNPQFETYGSGRTDAGVHALAQVVHLDVPSVLPTNTLVARVNDGLPHDINVISAERMPPRFHARHSATARHYLYQISRRRSAFHKPHIWWVKDELDITRMREAAARLTGFADFRAFTDDDPEEKSTQVLLTRLEITEADPLILIHVSGSHFLWKMVRRLVGILVACGKGDLSPQQVEQLLTNESPLPAQLTAPAAGLFLERVDY
jgi:tRNA pseudouridine38-40 synthase